MKPVSARRLGSRGFTLIEMIAVVVLLAIAATTIIRMQGNLFSQQTGVTDMQVASRLQVACAEQVLQVQRQDGIDQVTNVTTANGGSGRFGTQLCDTLTTNGLVMSNGTAFTVPSVTVNDNYSGTGTGCPSQSSCKLVTVTQGSLQPLVFMLVSY